ncbi:MAG TPA: hypothetical protein VIS49_10930 [Cyclobacteriaceae bacterium]
MEANKFNVDPKVYEQIALMIQSDASPVGIDAKKTHIIILNKLEEINTRLERVEQQLKKK